MSIENIPASTELDSPLVHGVEKFKHAGHVRVMVVTPESTLLDEPAEFVALPLFDGEIGIMHGRAPLIGRLGSGELRIRRGGDTRHFFVDGGFAQVRDDVVTVLTSRAIPAAAIDVPAYQAELDRAAVARAVTDLELAERSRTVQRARAAIRVASTRR